jgi:superfamily II DNA or RNA helicase
MLKALWNKFKAYQTYAPTKERVKEIFRRYEEAKGAVQRLSELQAETIKAVAKAHVECQVSKPTARVRIDPDHISGPELILLEAVARHLNTRNNLPQALATIQAKEAELQPGLAWIRNQAALPNLKYDGVMQASIIGYIETIAPFIEKLEVACEVERRLLAWLPAQGPETVIKRFSDNSAWFYAALDSIVQPPPAFQTTRHNEGGARGSAQTNGGNIRETQASRDDERGPARAPRIRKTSALAQEVQPPAINLTSPEAPAESDQANETPSISPEKAKKDIPNPEPTEVLEQTSSPAHPQSPAATELQPDTQAVDLDPSYAEITTKAHKITTRHGSAHIYLGVLAETLKRLAEEISELNSKWLFERRLDLMRSIGVEKLADAPAFAEEVRKLGLMTAYDLIAAAAKGPISVGLTVDGARLAQTTKLNYNTAIVAMMAVKEAIEQTKATLRLRLDPDEISTDEKLLLEAAARYINVSNLLPGVMDKMNARLAAISEGVAEIRWRAANPSIKSDRKTRAEFADYCDALTASLERFESDCEKYGKTLLALPSEGPMEVVRRFSENGAWFYATLEAIIPPAPKPKPSSQPPAPTPQAQTSWSQRPGFKNTDQSIRDAGTSRAIKAPTEDPERPKLRRAPSRDFTPFDWGTSNDDSAKNKRADQQPEQIEYEPLPDASQDSDHGHVPLEIAQAVEGLDLRRGPLKATLRRYQMFGAQFMLKQQRTLLGDDMGLGKTVQALAAMCHLHAEGKGHFLVVAPNSVLINWEREVATHTGLKAFVLHGTERLRACMDWSRSGGVGITTFDTIGVMLNHIEKIDMLVVDEAHKIKNPKAKRTRRIKIAASKSPFVALLSGTALENRISELHALVCLAQPNIKASADYLLSSARPSAGEARRRIAAAYLRRTQADVLSELPEMTKVDEYVSLSDEELDSEEAQKVHVQNQRIATTVGTGDGNSAKYTRLRELLEFYRSNRDKVVIFSAFRQVLNDVATICGGCDQITGEVSPAGRMNMIDRLKAKDGFGCLALQVEAGGQGLNIQFARVVILMEPQFKPSTENQAIARVHRMGQGRKVIVHRLIAKDSIDDDLVELIKYKQQIFDDYAHQSAVKDESGMAIDSSSVQQEIADELQRRADERRRRRAEAG